MNANPDGAFAVMMLTLPLAERYFREKVGIGDATLNSAFHLEFANAFNINEQISRDFWQVYRNGLMHQATLSKVNRNGITMPRGLMTLKTAATPHSINFDSTTNEFAVLPKELSEEVIKIIRNDFLTFESQGNVRNPAPIVLNSTPFTTFAPPYQGPSAAATGVP
jgi:hypothetical protein